MRLCRGPDSRTHGGPGEAGEAIEGGRGMRKFARVSRYKSSVAEMARVEEVAANLIPRVREIEGCVGALFLVDRLSGRSMSISFWDSEQSMLNSEEEGNRLRREVSEKADERILFIERYEIAYEM
jgi:quinol monooxygenase YgiN